MWESTQDRAAALAPAYTTARHRSRDCYSPMNSTNTRAPKHGPVGNSALCTLQCALGRVSPVTLRRTYGNLRESSTRKVTQRHLAKRHRPQPPSASATRASTALDDPSLFINRELSLLDFQRRVLEEAQDGTNPLLDRVMFLSFVGSNLDEFFMVRVAGLKRQIEKGVTDSGPDAMTPSRAIARHSRLGDPAESRGLRVLVEGTGAGAAQGRTAHRQSSPISPTSSARSPTRIFRTRSSPR